MTKEKRLEKALTEEKYRYRMVKSKKSWVIKGMLFSTLLISGMSIQANVYAEEWSANAPASIQIESGATSYTLKDGDTLWAVSQVTNIKVETLAEINDIDLTSGEQYSLEIGRIIYFDGNHVTILDKDGNVVADKVLDDNDKVDSSKPFADQNSDIPKNPVVADTDGNVKIQEDTNSNQNSDGNSSSKNNGVGNNQSGNSNQTDTGNNNGQEINKPTNPEKTTEPSKPVAPEEKEFAVSVIHRDNEGNILEKEADIKVKKGETYTVSSKEFDGYTLTGQATQTVKVDSDKVITFVYQKNEKPNPSEKFDIAIKYVDENDKEIAETDTIKIEKGQEYTATAKTIEGYSLVGEATKSITVEKSETITFKYTKNQNPVEKFKITVKYEDEDGNEISSYEIHEIEKGQVFTAQAKDIKNYTLIGDINQSITVTSDETIIFKYIKNEEPAVKYPVIVQYKDEEGNLLDSDTPVEIEAGKSFTATAKNINGYTLQGENTQTIIVKKLETLVFVYKKDETPAIVDKSELENLINSVKDTEQGNYTNESFNNFKSVLDNAITILNYEKVTQIEVDNAKSNLQNAYDNLEEKAPEVTKYKVTVEHKDTDGNVLETESPIEVDKGTNYTANSKTFDGYILQGVTSQTVTVTGDITLTFIYANYEVTPPTIEVSEVEAKIASETLALINAHRNENGLNTLRNQSQLQSASNVRSEEIVELFEHTRPNGEFCDEAAYEQGYDGLVGENIYANYQPSSLEWWAENGASLAFNAWENSSGHNATMLEKRFTEGAVGINLNQVQGGQFAKYTFYAVFMPGLRWDEWGQDNSLSKTRALVPETESIQNVTVVEENEVKEELTEAKGVEQEITVEATEETIEKTIEAPLEEVIQETSESKVQEETITEIEGTLINRDKLSEAYNLALTLEESNYSVHSWSVLIIKLADAKYVYDNPDSNQSDIDNATLAMQQAINNLV